MVTPSLRYSVEQDSDLPASLSEQFTTFVQSCCLHGQILGDTTLAYEDYSAATAAMSHSFEVLHCDAILTVPLFYLQHHASLSCRRMPPEEIRTKTIETPLEGPRAAQTSPFLPCHGQGSTTNLQMKHLEYVEYLTAPKYTPYRTRMIVRYLGP